MNANLFLGDCLEVMGSKRFIDSVGGGVPKLRYCYGPTV